MFSDVTLVEDESNREWPEAARLRDLAQALQNVFAQYEQRNPLCDEFLDLCSMHGESHPGEPRLARMFLSRIERGEVGTANRGTRETMVVLHAFLALAAGFATMAVLVAIVTVLLQKLTPDWAESGRSSEAGVYVRQSRLLIPCRGGGWLRHCVDR